MSTSYNNLGLVYRSKKEYSKAIYYYKKSLEIKQASNDIQGMVNAYMNIGSAFQNNSMYDSAYY
ncbi:MAG: tetratricopeptide repeat protein [Bacteroidetes bacterium]|nr:tetratricopeptide repeat protein [Bacteroidota bacterium]